MSSPWNRRMSPPCCFLPSSQPVMLPCRFRRPMAAVAAATPLVIDSTNPASNALVAPYGQPVYAYTDTRRASVDG